MDTDALKAWLLAKLGYDIGKELGEKVDDVLSEKIERPTMTLFGGDLHLHFNMSFTVPKRNVRDIETIKILRKRIAELDPQNEYRGGL